MPLDKTPTDKGKRLTLRKTATFIAGAIAKMLFSSMMREVTSSADIEVCGDVDDLFDDLHVEVLDSDDMIEEGDSIN